MSSTSLVEIAVQADLEPSILALPRSINKTIKHLPLSNSDFPQIPTLQFEQSLAEVGSFVHFKASSAIFTTISYKLIDSGRILVLNPLLVNNSLSLSLKSLSFVLPQQAKPNCITVLDVGSTVLVEILTTENILISLNLPLTSFLQQETLSLAKFYSWCNYSAPYSFDVRAPLFMRAIEPYTIIVALRDGGLLKMSKENPSDNYLVVPFNDASYVNQFKLPFFRSKKDQTETITINNVQVSTTAVLDFVVKDNSLITLSVDKIIRFWSLETGAMERQIGANEYIAPELQSVSITTGPTQLLNLTDNYLWVFVPIGETSLKLFSIDSSDSPVLLVDYNLPDIGNWLFHSVKVTKVDSKYQIHILWTLHGAKWMLLGELSDNLTITWSQSSPEPQYNLGQSIVFYEDAESLNSHCLQLLQVYNERVVEKVLELFVSKHNLQTSTLPLQQKLLQVITYNLDETEYLQNLKKQWVKFDNACKELSKQLEPALSFDFVDAFLVISKSSGYTVLAKAPPVLLLSSKDTVSSEDLQFPNIDVKELQPLTKYVLSFSEKFPQEVVYNVERRVLEHRNSPEAQMKTIFEENLSSFVDEAMVTELLTALNASQNTMSLFEFLISLPTLDNVGYSPVKKVPFGNLGSSLLSSVLKSDLVLQKRLVLGMLLIVLTVDINPQMISYYTELSKLYKHLDFPLQVSSDVVLKYLEEVYEGGALIRQNSLNFLVSHSFGYLTDKPFVYSVLAQLVSREETIDTRLIDFLPETGVSSVLKGIALLNTGHGDEAFEMFSSKADEITGAGKSVSFAEKKALQPIADYTNLILVESKPDYYYDLSTLFQSKQHDQYALKFALKALATKTEIKDTSDDQAILLKIFQLALKLQEFELAHDTILKMERKFRKHPIKQFVYKLFQLSQISKILDYPFNEDADKVDDLIYSLGESSALNSDVTNSLKYYRICYTLRLKQGDYRAAVEALYRFNCIALELKKQNKFSGYKLLSDNYLTILNLLNTLEKDDQWIIRQPVQLVQTSQSETPAATQKNVVVYSSDLEKELEALMT